MLMAVRRCYIDGVAVWQRCALHNCTMSNSDRIDWMAATVYSSLHYRPPHRKHWNLSNRQRLGFPADWGCSMNCSTSEIIHFNIFPNQLECLWCVFFWFLFLFEFWFFLYCAKHFFWMGWRERWGMKGVEEKGQRKIKKQQQEQQRKNRISVCVSFSLCFVCSCVRLLSSNNNAIQDYYYYYFSLGLCCLIHKLNRNRGSLVHSHHSVRWVLPNERLAKCVFSISWLHLACTHHAHYRDQSDSSLFVSLYLCFDGYVFVFCVGVCVCIDMCESVYVLSVSHNWATSATNKNIQSMHFYMFSDDIFCLFF